jgi:hypothetical protein
MPLKILCAGCSKDERAIIESGVSAGLGERTGREAWTVSVVKFGSGWSVTLDGPFERTRGLSFMLAGAAGPEALAHAVRSAADPGDGSRVSPTPAADKGPTTATSMAAATLREGGRGPHKCIVCGRQYILIYEEEPGEPLEDAPVACPHCWQLGTVQVSRSASVGQDYRAEKV